MRKNNFMKNIKNKSNNFFSVINAVICKDFNIQRRYLPNLTAKFIQLGLRVFFFFMMARSVAVTGSQDNILRKEDLFLFFLCAMLLLVFRDSALWTPVGTVIQDRNNGTLEYLYSTPVSRYAYYLGSVIYSSAIGFLAFLPLFFLLIIKSGAGLFNGFMIIMVTILVVLTLTALGIMIAMLALIWRQVSAMTNILGLIFEFLGGAYFSVSNFPPLFRGLAGLLPHTWGYDLIRYYTFSGSWNPLLPIGTEWGILFIQMLIFTLISLILLRFTEKKVRVLGFSSL